MIMIGFYHKKNKKMMKTMEKLMQKLFMDDKNQVRYQNDPQVRNPNFIRKQDLLFLKLCKRGKRNSNDQHIRPPFHENLDDEDFMEKPEDHIH